MTYTDEFHDQYRAALRNYLATRDEDSLAVGHELGRRALQEQISMLDIIENTFWLLDEFSKTEPVDRGTALEFVLQTLAPLDVATRGFIDGTRRYAQERARAEDLADRDRFRTALVNSLQEGFFVADEHGAVVEVNNAFADILGYGEDGLPYPWPQPWLVDREGTYTEQQRVRDQGSAEYEIPVRHQDGHLAWVAVSINAVREPDGGADMYVGTVRDVTAQRAFAARESAVMRLATSVSVAKSVAEVLEITLEESRSAVDVHRVVAVMWPAGEGEPTVVVAGDPPESNWRTMEPTLREIFQDARHQLPLTAKTVGSPDSPGRARGLVAMLSGAGDVALWLELGSPRWVSAEDKLLVTMLIGHLSLAIQHVRQFEAARVTSMTLQRAMLPPMTPPPGFAVRYEPAVPPLEIGGDWYDVLPIDDRRIGIVVGDCVGRGLPAAAIMGQLRSSARALLLTGAKPAVLLEQLDAAASLIPDAYCTTVFLAILDTGTGVLEYSNAGHMPAVLVRTEAGSPPETLLLTNASSVPLAVRRNETRPQAAEALYPGSMLMWFTDGLVERRHESIDDGLARVADVLTDAIGLPISAVADAVLEQLAPAGGYDDDVAMVVYRHQLAPLRIEAEATAENLAPVRRALTSWLRAADVSDLQAADIVLVISEACTNCVEHAYQGHEVGTMLLEMTATDGEIRARITDSGTWKPPAADPGNGGRGLPLMKVMSESMRIDDRPDGTTIDIIFRLPRG
ncbi:SpoIIE family protein phosphatase [Mycobacterium gordonae]|uniref:Stage II sporulation protein E n=1 Tax=Mycobacterium gordonae TaxID=1778 RepID=A0A1X1VM86_MYCGO|nr:SpoIIE family protein phosphatase [Mycobacterium gordonae]MCV7007748.1 SpoIIE family protein phosphatase [Mycobacterium gordonae]ODR17629.1 stage II sporulation protein E [Mycobacterium gordonae]ORV70177.1 stage II sporulation protein E [Mycobacterium gordonae]